MSRKIVLFLDENIAKEDLNIKKIESQLPNADIKEVISARKSFKGSSDEQLSEEFFDRMKELIQKDKSYFGFFATCDKGLATESWVPKREDVPTILEEHCRLITICLWGKGNITFNPRWLRYKNSHNKREKKQISKEIIQETRRILRHQT